MAGGDFSRLSAGDKVLIALNLTGENLFNNVANTNWPNFLGHLVQGLFNPRVGLMGIVHGLSMTLSGFANLASLEQWEANPLGNLLKSAADIAMGITVILGSITLLATAIGIILTAIAILGSIVHLAPWSSPSSDHCFLLDRGNDGRWLDDRWLRLPCSCRNWCSIKT